MAGVFALSDLDIPTRLRIAIELTPKKKTRGNATVPMYKLYNKKDRVYVPYYYGKCMSLASTASFNDAMMSGLADTIILNDRPDEQTVLSSTFRGRLRTNQLEPFENAASLMITKGSVFVKAATGTGKSVALAYLTTRVNVLSLIYATNNTFTSQIDKTIREMTTAIVWYPSAKKPNPPDGVQVIVVSPKQFHRIPKTIVDAIGLLIMDEAHLVCTLQNIQQLLSLRPRYVVGMTATDKRIDGMEIFIKYMCGPHLVVIPLGVPIKYLRYQTGVTIPFFPGPDGKEGSWVQHANYIANCMERNIIIADLCKDVLAMNNNDSTPSLIKTLFSQFNYRLGTKFKLILITANAKDHNAAMISLLRERGITCDYRDDSKNEYIDCDVLVGYGSKNGTGFDQQMSCTDHDGILINVVVPLLTSATPMICEQRMGRGCRAEECFGIDLEDGGPYNKRHYRDGMLEFLNPLSDCEIIEYDVTEELNLTGKETIRNTKKMVDEQDATLTIAKTLYTLPGLTITKLARKRVLKNPVV